MSRYDDMIDLPHHVSPTRPRMSMAARAAQFAPFAALTGHSSAISETARLTVPRAELSEDRLAFLDARLRLLRDSLADRPEAEITYFERDTQKPGGSYVTVKGAVKRFDEEARAVIMHTGEVIPVEEIFAVDSELFAQSDAGGG